MKFAIISAGEGSRLSQEGVIRPKPLVRLNGIPMIERLVGIFGRCGADEIEIIINNQREETKQAVDELQKKSATPINKVVKTTPSSMHSFYELSPLLEGNKFCLTTVDTIFKEEEFKRYINTFENTECDGIMAVTDFVDDEKPLYVETDENLNITAFLDKPSLQSRYISGGIYCLSPRSLDVLRTCLEKGLSRMRNYQRELIAAGLKLKAYPFSKILDVDHVSDITKAEEFLRSED